MTFADLGLGPEILKAVEEAGYVDPTPIQEQAIPVILMGRDVLGVAQTGTGKTAGFTLPMIEILAGSRAKARMPRSLILAPTRELAAQVAENFEKYGKYHRLTMARLIGGESFVDQEKLLDRGVDVLIATPGRLMDLFDRGRILLNDVKILVIDEADRMLDMGFIPDVERIVSLLPKIRQTLFFSATMAPEIRRLADAFLMNPKEVTVDAQASTATTVEQFMVICDDQDKREALRRLIRSEDVKNALIFCNRKRDVDILYKSLTRHGFDAAQLHGDMAQSARTETLERFKSGTVRLLVCSDVAARGIDISDLSHVFNFDVPNHAEDYVHRIGRTGRAGKLGRSFTIAGPDDGKFVAAIRQLIGKEIPQVSIEGVAEASLDMQSSGRRRGNGRKPGDRSKDRDRTPRRASSGTTPAETASPIAPPVQEEPQQADRGQRAPRADRDWSGRSRNERPRSGDADRNRGRSHGDRDRRYRDDHGIGEMTHPDNVIGFGDALPDFLARPVPLPKIVDKKSEQEEETAPIVMMEEAPAKKKASPRKAPAKKAAAPRKAAAPAKSKVEKDTVEVAAPIEPAEPPAAIEASPLPETAAPAETAEKKKRPARKRAPAKTATPRKRAPAAKKAAPVGEDA
ncbi:DEAD/DEAH box helicase [Telmatospirillum siberiense]|uniref:DEAD-box ATP-dependent RNA helicase RhpA n=1 Tax=Telmatospirillum siberiense TaxID=382514 RepID=A0A2N3Q0Z1_9PROT|nr:DEAD/DEAH box helicase [Telmatospirillum siberiense]PKU26317.1 DNA helicase [Telmatospirillum siberiense]